MDRQESPHPRSPRRTLRSVADEAARLGVSTGWLYQEARAGRFPHLRFGNRVLLDPDEVDCFLAARCVSVDEALRRAEEFDDH